MCGINLSSDDDSSALAFTTHTGDTNCWGDSWRGDQQAGTVWSFWNDDFRRPIGAGGGQGLAGFKGGGNMDTYELSVSGAGPAGLRRPALSFGGLIAEMAIYDQVLSDYERRCIEMHLATKYGIAAPEVMTYTAGDVGSASCAHGYD